VTKKQSTLPENGIQFLDWDWSQIEPIFQALGRRQLNESNILDWLDEWSEISKLLDERYWRLYDATTVDTSNQKAEKEFARFLDEIRPRAKTSEQSLKRILLESGLNPPGYQIAIRDLRAQAEIYREENLPLLSEEKKLVIDYDKIIGAQTVTWEGEQVPLPQLQPVYQEPQRERREEAWRLVASRQLVDRQAINTLWSKFLGLRSSIAENAGLPNYRAYRWKELLRFDYEPEDCFNFHQAIEEVVVPAALEIYEKRRQRLGLNSLRPWDLAVDPYGKPPLMPFQTVKELIDKSGKMFAQVDTHFDQYFQQMQEEDLLDLENRGNKAPGGYCSYYRFSRRPFIFMNAVGIHEDVQTLLHEGGHAFQIFECGHRPYFFLEIPSEFAEVASMAMELLASPYLETSKGGFYNTDQAARARIQHLESLVLFWPYMAVVDAFQHWVYENPEAAREADRCDDCWAQLWERFMPGVDWTGLEQELRTGWQRKPHIFDEPFYYVEYGMAQLGALQIWRNSLRDAESAIASYRQALSLGTSVTIPRLYEAAGADFAFDTGTLKEAVDAIRETITNLEVVID
jgi:oligoendopeptidase F